MGNLFDYLDWRGDIPFSTDPFNEVDNLVLSELSYVDFEGIVPAPTPPSSPPASFAGSAASPPRPPMPSPRDAAPPPAASSPLPPASFAGSAASSAEVPSSREDGTRDKAAGGAELRFVPIREACERFWELHSEDEVKRSGTLFKMAPYLLKRLCTGARFGGMLLGGYVNYVSSESEEQMSAITFLLEDGTAYVAYRGTDDTLVGWKEDFAFAYREATAGQESAASYLSTVAAALFCASADPSDPAADASADPTGPDPDTAVRPSSSGGDAAPGPSPGGTGKTDASFRSPLSLRVGGHSKGGNFAIYACARCAESVRKRILEVYSNDGPGFLPRFISSDGYHRILPKIRRIIPEESIFGLLLDVGRDHSVVRSSNRGIWQHDPLSWEVIRNRFLRAPRISDRSLMAKNAFESWISGMSLKERREMTEILFSLFSESGVENLSDIMMEYFRSIPELMRAYWELSGRDRHFLHDSVGKLLISGVNSLTEGIQNRLTIF